MQYGDGSGVPVLALHGWLDNAASFATLAPLIVQDGFATVVAVDMPGHGESGHRGADGSYHFVDWVADVRRALDALGWETCHLLGHSMGAAIAALFAGTYPERIKGLCAIEGLTPLTSEADEMPVRLAQALNAQTKLADKRLPVYSTVAAALAARAKVGDFAQPELAADIVARGLKAVDGGFTWRSDPRLTLPSMQRLTAAQVGAFLTRIACPVLVFRASRGFPFDAAIFDDLVNRVADLDLERVEGGPSCAPGAASGDSGRDPALSSKKNTLTLLAKAP